jgi:hypothetical protein
VDDRSTVEHEVADLERETRDRHHRAVARGLEHDAERAPARVQKRTLMEEATTYSLRTKRLTKNTAAAMAMITGPVSR